MHKKKIFYKTVYFIGIFLRALLAFDLKALTIIFSEGCVNVFVVFIKLKTTGQSHTIQNKLVNWFWMSLINFLIENEVFDEMRTSRE